MMVVLLQSKLKSCIYDGCFATEQTEEFYLLMFFLLQSKAEFYA